MPNKTIYVADGDLHYWEAAVNIAARRGTSISKVLGTLVRGFVDTDNDGTGLPVGFRVPTSMKDPVTLERERLADDVRALMMEFLVRADDRLEKVAES